MRKGVRGARGGVERAGSRATAIGVAPVVLRAAPIHVHHVAVPVAERVVDVADHDRDHDHDTVASDPTQDLRVR